MTSMLTPERWAAVQAVFHKIADVPKSERDAVLAGLCGADTALEQAVRELLRGEDQDVSVFDEGVDAVAGRVLTQAMPAASYGPYRVERLIGEGGMGVIYLATRDDVGQTVAIKVLRNVWLSQMGRQRFAAEQRALARLSHPSIASLYDADTEPDGTPWFAMEYVEGRPLIEAAHHHGLGFVERVRLFRDVCEAVQHAHQHLIVHRDLKPSNILITPDRRVKLLDFGIAKPMDLLDDESSARTATAARLMTLNYAAPEQLTGGVVGIHTDIYALGVILYELLAGRVPLDLTGLAPLETQTMLVDRVPVKPSAAAREREAGVQASRSNWADIDVLCLTALQKSPERRYRTVDAMIGDVDRLLTGRPLSARADSMAYRAGKFVRRHWQGALVTAAAVVVVAGLSGYYTVRLRVARDAAVAEASRASRVLLFMEKLFEGGESDDAPARDLRVLTLVDRGAREARSLHAQPEVQAELYEVLGTIYQSLGELQKADELLQASLKAARTSGTGQEPTSLIALGLLRSDQAKLEEAESLTRAALDAATRTLPPEHPTVAKAQLALGKVLRDRGQYAQAVEHLERAVAGYSTSPQTEAELGVALTELANTHYYAGRLDLSERLNERVLALDRRTYGDAHPAVADDLINLGAIQDALGRSPAAVPRYREALAIFEQWYGPRHPETASAMTGLAQVLLRLKQTDEASPLFTRAHDIFNATYKESHPRKAMALTGIGLVALERRQFEVADDAFTRSLQIYRDVYGAKHSRLAAMLVNLAALALARQDTGSGERLLREALQMYEATLPGTHATTAATRVRLGQYLIAQRRYPEAEEQLLLAKQVLAQQPVPPIASLRAATEALAQVFEATGRRAEAEQARVEAGSLPK
jgi:serine/threonine-protein kinase